jgi:protocatechuate 3,4-dioxygenase beta subunit
MPAKFMGSGVIYGTTYPMESEDRALVSRFAYPPDSKKRQKGSGIGQGDPNSLWPVSAAIKGGEETGMWPMCMDVTCDDDLRIQGSEACPYTITGTAIDTATGLPAPGVTVELWWINVDYPDAHQPQLIATTVADANGVYGFLVDNNTKKYKVEVYDGARGGVTGRNLVGT